MRRLIMGIFLILGTVALAACAPAAPPPAPQAPAPAPAAAPTPAGPAAVPVRPAWELEWERTVAAAKKEGTVSLLTATGPETRRVASQAFKSKFDISIEWIAGTSTELSVRVLNERRAGIHSMDAGIIGFSAPYGMLKPAGALESMNKVLFLPELTDPQEIKKVWRLGKVEWIDNDHTILVYALYVNYAVVVNTKLVKPEEMVSFRDLLNPKWKGKIAMFDPTLEGGSGASWLQPVGSQIMSWDYVRQLAGQELILTRDARLLAEWIAQGKYPIGLALRGELVKNFKDVGAPIKGLFLKEGNLTTPGPNGLSLIKDAPHPNAAKLFLNWLLSKEGQTLWCTAYGYPSARLDVTIQGIDPDTIPDPKALHSRVDTEEALRARPETVKMAQEIFSALKK